MSFRHHAMATLVAACLTLGIAPAFAGRIDPTPATPSTGLPGGTPTGSVSATTTDCNLGVVGPPTTDPYGYVYPPDDEYYTLIRPAICGECPTNTHVLTVAHMELEFTASCEIPVTISIVPAVDLGGGCLAPDRSAPEICGPVSYGISDQVIGPCVDYALPVPAGCSIDGPAFLKIVFNQGTCPRGRPQFCGLTTCDNCAQYNFFPTSPGFDDLCSIFPGPLKSLVMYVESTCSAPTSTVPASWGRLKTLYR